MCHEESVEPGRNGPGGFKSQIHRFPAENVDKLFSFSKLFPHLHCVESYQMSLLFSLSSVVEPPLQAKCYAEQQGLSGEQSQMRIFPLRAPYLERQH